VWPITFEYENSIKNKCIMNIKYGREYVFVAKAKTTRLSKHPLPKSISVF